MAILFQVIPIYCGDDYTNNQALQILGVDGKGGTNPGTVYKKQPRPSADKRPRRPKTLDLPAVVKHISRAQIAMVKDRDNTTKANENMVQYANYHRSQITE